MKTLVRSLLLIAAAVPVHAAGKLDVVTTTADLAAVARAVGGDGVTVTALARPTEDPHFVDAKPSFIKLVNEADVLIEGGASLEAGWLPPLLDGARNAKIATGAPGRVVAATDLPLLDVPQQLDRAAGDVHPQGNPHFMLDPMAAKVVAKTITNAFCAVDQARCADYQARLATLQTAIDDGLAAWRATLEPFQGTKVVTYHKDFDYFFRRFGFMVVDTLEPKPGIPPSPTHLTELIPRMKDAHVRLIVVEPYRERSNPDFVAQSTGAKVLLLPAMPEGDQGYVDFIGADVKALAAALRDGATKP